MQYIKVTPDFLPIEKVDFTKEQLVEIYNAVFKKVHSEGFMIAEVKDLLYLENYFFIEPRQKEWEENLKTKLISFGYDIKRSK